MPPRRYSRYTFSLGKYDDEDKLFLRERRNFPYDKKLPGTIKHVVTSGDTVYSLAAKYFHIFDEDADHMWWIICEFQPSPIMDPTLGLEVGRILFIPSIRVVQERILSGNY